MAIMKVFVLAALLGSAFAADNAAEDAEWKMTPVKKVIKLLTDMQNQLEKEASEDDEIMEKMLCWCETNDKAKSAAIKDATAEIAQLEETVESKTALAAQLKSELEQLAKDVAGNQAELAEATAIRNKEHSEFEQAEKDQMTSITGLTKAVDAIAAKTGGASLVQVMSDLRKTLHGRNAKALDHLDAVQRAKVSMFLQTDATLKSKAPASAEVFGVLKQMKESFETGLKDSQNDEADAQKAFDEMKTAKEGELSSANDMIDSKSKQSAETVETLAQAKADLGDTKVQLEADTKFLADLKERCANMDEEFAARKKVRNEEIKAVGEAMGILTSDEAHDQFNKSLGFIQIKAHRGAGSAASSEGAMLRSRTRAARLLIEAGTRLASPRLSELSVMVRSGGVFDKINKAIDEMIVQLKQENEDEMKHRDFCISELNQNERQMDDGYDDKKELETGLEENELLKKSLAQEMAESTKEIADTLLQMKFASENRETESKEFQVTVADQKATQAILTKALDKLKGFYNKKALLQAGGRSASNGMQAPPAGFKERTGARGGAGGVMMMMEGIIKESENVESDAVAAEQEAVAAYEKYVEESNAVLDALRRGVTEKKEATAKADEAIAQAHQDLQDNMAHLQQLHDYNAELHSSCDFTIKNYETRMNARAAEMEALNQAKAIMSGADPAAFR